MQYAEEISESQTISDNWYIRRDAEGVLHLHNAQGIRLGTFQNFQLLTSPWAERQRIQVEIEMVPGLQIIPGGPADTTLDGIQGPRAIGHTRKLR